MANYISNLTGEQIEARLTNYGVCESSADSAVKEVIFPAIGSGWSTFNFENFIGVSIRVKFVNTNTCEGGISLKIGETVKAIKCYDGSDIGGTEFSSWKANSILTFTYDGAYWILQDYFQDETITNSQATTIKLGGISIGESLEGLTAVEVLEKILYPYVAFSISCKSSPAASTIKEKGPSAAVESISYTITNGSVPVNEVTLYRGNSSSGTKLDSVSGTNLTSASFTLTAENITSKTVYTVKATDGTSTKEATVAPFTFVDPFFYGVLASDELPSTELSSITGVSKDISVSETKTYSFSADGEYPFIAYPATYGELSSVKDSNGFEYLDSFTKSTISAVVASGTVEYLVYIQKNAVYDTAGFSYTFEGC